jgi:hypothetical protein
MTTTEATAYAVSGPQRIRINNRAEKARCAIDDADDHLLATIRVFEGPLNEDALIAKDLIGDARALLRAARYLIAEAREKIDPTIVANR